MARIESFRPELAEAKKALSPTTYDFQQIGSGWIKNFPAMGEDIVIAPVGRENHHTLRLVSTLQQTIWGADDRFVSPSKLSNAEETGGALWLAYSAKGTDSGLYGFLYGTGGNDKYSSEMLGIAEDAREADLGWYMKIIQAYDALAKGYTSIHWTYDPLRGKNAILNIEKLAGKVDTYYFDRYGVWDSKFNGEFPTPRFGVTVDLISPRTHKRIRDIHEGRYQRFLLSDIEDFPQVTAENVEELDKKKTSVIKYEIPAIVDKLLLSERGKWIEESQKVFSTLLTTETPREDKSHPEKSWRELKQGNYTVSNVVTGFVTENDKNIRKNFYVLTRKITA
ncbi:MAG TPA: hypothetical protein VE090_05395 [Methylomirabilota bacterium]|nr:hypothetical protein [Methylomirabilota bacterium]